MALGFAPSISFQLSRQKAIFLAHPHSMDVCVFLFPARRLRRSGGACSDRGSIGKGMEEEDGEAPTVRLSLLTPFHRWGLVFFVLLYGNTDATTT